MNQQQRRLVAVLTTMHDLLLLVIVELLAGRLAAEARVQVAKALRTLANDLDPPETSQ